MSGPHVPTPKPGGSVYVGGYYFIVLVYTLNLKIDTNMPKGEKGKQEVANTPGEGGAKAQGEKDRKLAPAEYVAEEDEAQPLPELPPWGEDDKRQSGRPASEESR